MGFLAAFFLAWPIFRVASPLQINANEPWNAWFIDAVLARRLRFIRVPMS